MEEMRRWAAGVSLDAYMRVIRSAALAFHTRRGGGARETDGEVEGGRQTEGERKD